MKLAGQVGFGPLFREPGQGRILADLRQGGRSADFLQGAGDVNLFPLRGRGLKQGEDLFFFLLARPGLGKGREGVAADFFLGVLQEAAQPGADGFVQGRRGRFGKAGAEGPDQGDLANSFLRGGPVKAGNFLFP